MFFLISHCGSPVFKHEIHCVKATIKQWKQQSKGIWLLGEPAVTCLHSLSLLIHGSALFIAQFSNTRCWLKLLERKHNFGKLFIIYSDLLDPRAHFINSYFLCVFWRLVSDILSMRMHSKKKNFCKHVGPLVIQNQDFPLYDIQVLIIFFAQLFKQTSPTFTTRHPQRRTFL